VTGKSTPTNRVERTATLKWVPIALMRVSALAQRELNQSWVDHLAASFDLEQLGAPTVNKRDNGYFIIDGQHRIEALKAMGWEDQQVQCWTYEGLTEMEEAEKFLRLNDVKAVAALPKFKVAVVAGRQRERDIYRIVKQNGCAVTYDDVDGAIGAVGTLIRIYDRSGPNVLGRTLRMIRDAYGTPGFSAATLDGIALLCDRYNGDLEDQLAIAKLSKVHGGVSGLLGRAQVIRQQTKQPLNQSVAAAAVDIINAGRGGKKLPGWFREDAA